MSTAEHLSSQSEPVGRIRVEGTIVILENVAIADAEIAEILRQVPDPQRVQFVTRGLRGGVIAMGNEMTSRLNDAVRFMHSTLDAQVASFGDRMSEKVSEQLGDADNDGHVQRRVNEILVRWASQLKTDFERSLPEAFDGQTKRSVDRIQAEGERVLKQIMSLFSENGLAFNELREIRRDFAQRLEEFKTAVTVAQTKAANPSPRDAGLSYEAMVRGRLATIGSLRGDDVEDTANKVGKIPHCKKGDTRILPAVPGVEVVAEPCIAVEIRDREENEFSLADVEMMMRNREAQAAIVVAAHAGSLPKQYAGQPFAMSRPKRLITLVLNAESPDAEVVLAAAYNLACLLAIESVRQLRDGDWEAVARKAEAIQLVIEGMVEDQAAFMHIERKAHDGLTKASKRHVDLVRLISELAALVRSS